ncbi:hypothetical protein HYZ99_03335, partial [Candidatus Peregrinibacteria bacterium]|nr:hypothetical protein [Candidatus Peregrinibacteria bacterium]
MPLRARSAPNIALIKYWGNAHEEFRLPAADSLSMTLGHPHVEVTVEQSAEFHIDSFEADGSKHPLASHHLERLKKHLELTKRYLDQLNIHDTMPKSVSLKIVSAIPAGIGLASSAAVFSAIAEAYAGLVKEKQQLTREEVSVIARLGSGSAARSVYGGFVSLSGAAAESLDASRARQIANEDHWLLHDIVIIPNKQPKKIGSTEGHALASTSPLFQNRKKAIPRRMKECIDAILTKNFEKLQAVSEEDALDMHEVMRTSTPSLNYLSKETHRVVADITQLRQKEHIPVLYTMD